MVSARVPFGYAHEKLNSLPGDAAGTDNDTDTAGGGPQRKAGVVPDREAGADGSDARTRKRQKSVAAKAHAVGRFVVRGRVTLTAHVESKPVFGAGKPVSAAARGSAETNTTSLPDNVVAAISSTVTDSA